MKCSRFLLCFKPLKHIDVKGKYIIFNIRPLLDDKKMRLWPFWLTALVIYIFRFLKTSIFQSDRGRTIIRFIVFFSLKKLNIHKDVTSSVAPSSEEGAAANPALDAGGENPRQIKPGESRRNPHWSFVAFFHEPQKWRDQSAHLTMKWHLKSANPFPDRLQKNPAKKAQREYSGVAPVPPRHLGGLISDHTGKLKGKGGWGGTSSP